MAPETQPAGPDAWDTPGRVLSAVFLAVSAGLLAGWLPNYLRWPLYWDTEHFAQMAREWDAGVSRPYRDVLTYNWPGQIYLFWAAGKLFGWGKSVAVQAVDVALLLAFGAGLIGWSRRRFGSVLPGTLAWVGLLAFYTNCAYILAGQRTWQAGLLAAGSLMTAQAAKGRAGAAAAGFLLAAALMFRPDAAVWALGLAATLVLREGPGSGRNAVGSLAACGVGGLAGLVLGFAPLAAAGLLGDFARQFLDGSRGKLYDPETMQAQRVMTLLGELPYYECFRTYDLRLFVVALPGLWAVGLLRGRGPVRREVAVWAGMMVAVAVAAFRMPYFIGYLVLPIVIAAMVSVAPAVAALRGDLARSPVVGVLVVLLFGGLLVPGIPAYCRPGLTAETAAALIGRRHVESPPVFHQDAFAGPDAGARWRDYREAVGYLRDGLPRGYSVANGLDPFGRYAGLAVVFPTKRKAAGAMNALLQPSLPTPLFEHVLEEISGGTRTAVVVATSQVDAHPASAPEPPTKLGRWEARLVETLRQRYRPAARFGGIEVWVNSPGLAAPRVAAKVDRPAPR